MFSQNTIPGRIAYFPIVGRLDCASSSVEHLGFWQMDGYGIMSMYKSDWERVGGECSLNYIFMLKLIFSLILLLLGGGGCGGGSAEGGGC